MIKLDAKNVFKRHKAMLMAKGYSQIAGLDFEKTFAPVVRIESVWALLALAVYLGLQIIHLDCKNAFLHGYSDIEPYVQ